MWQDYWNLSSDPFLGPSRSFVASTTHDEAVARLVWTIESGQRLAVVRGAGGSGKTVVLAEAMSRTSEIGRRFFSVATPVDSTSLYRGLAEGLGHRPGAVVGKASAWSALVDSVRLCHWQKIHPILVIDGPEDLGGDSGRRDMERLAGLAPNPSGRLTVVVAMGDAEERPSLAFSTGWPLSISLLPLTRTETGRYVHEKLALAGREDAVFTPKSLSRIYAISGGKPRGIDRLASLSLMAGALRRLELIPPEVRLRELIGSESAVETGWLVAPATRYGSINPA